HQPLLFGYILFIAITWNLQMFMWSHVLNKVSSMTALIILQQFLYLPLSLFVGAFFNHDIPNLYNFLAIGVLVIAFSLQPTHHQKNTRARFSIPLGVIIGLALIQTIINALNNGVTREALQILSPAAFLGIFSVTTMAACWLLALLIPR